jgi:hypothetical protein
MMAARMVALKDHLMVAQTAGTKDLEMEMKKVETKALLLVLYL